MRLVSPSGRWVVLEGNEETGDYIHHDALLMDASTGKLRPIKKGGWPKPLTQNQRDDLSQMAGKTAGTVGESDVRFFNGEILILDRLVVIPEKRIFEISGDLIR